MNKEKLLGLIYGHAMLTLCRKVAVMEAKGLTAEAQMNDCVLPILNEVKRRCKLVNEGDLTIQPNGFDECVKKQTIS